MPKDKKSSLEIIFQHLNLQQKPKPETSPAKIQMERPKTPPSPALSIETTISEAQSPEPLPEPKSIIIVSTEPSKPNNDCIEPNNKRPRIYPPSNTTTPPATNTNEKTTAPNNVYTKKHLLNNLPVAKAVLVHRGNETFSTKNPLFFNLSGRSYGIQNGGFGSPIRNLAAVARPPPLMSIRIPGPPTIQRLPHPYFNNKHSPTSYYWNKRN
ncbi:unnamed protein product [Meloidogyne enterolobii]|uniref:Uncharacterized protein n=1 Tax=Meloidogyne enterolobii TaxID=390850 RepID=A0ACB0YL41_MELEN